jgi:outer membrane protein assembly factor BamE
LAGCLYRPDVQQGNQLTAEMIAQIEPGMTRREVVKILGYPLVNDPFNRNRWDYFYSFKSGRSQQMIRYSAKLIFEGDYLSSIESNIPEEQPPEGSGDD